MSERTQGVLLLAAVLLAAAALYRVVGNSAGPVIIFAVISGYNAIQGAKRRENRRALDSILASLRAQGAEARQAALALIEPLALRSYLAAALEQDGSDERAGDAERFPFSQAVRRRVSRRYWLAWAAAALTLGGAAFGRMPAGGRVFLIATGATAAGATWLLARKQRLLATVVEITPFRVTEEWPDGLRRTVLFNRYLELENEARKKRVVLRPGGAAVEGIVLDYERLGFNRLLELVVRYGGFQVNSDPTDPS